MKEYIKGKCPVCGGRLYINKFGYQCESCSFNIPQFICTRHITVQDAEKILSGRYIILDGFSKKDGQIFTSIIRIKKQKLVLDNTICHCFLSGRGRIFVDTKFFRCDKHNSCQKDCCLAKIPGVRRCYDGHLITLEEITQLMWLYETSFPIRDIDGSEKTKKILFNGTKMKVV